VTTLTWGEIGAGDGALGPLPTWRSIAEEYRGTRCESGGTLCWTKDRRRAGLVLSEIYALQRLSRSQFWSLWSGFWAGGALLAARRVLFLAVRTACHPGCTADEDRSEIATLRAGWVRAAILRFGVGKRAEGTDW